MGESDNNWIIIVVLVILSNCLDLCMAPFQNKLQPQHDWMKSDWKADINDELIPVYSVLQKSTLDITKECIFISIIIARCVSFF